MIRSLLVVSTTCQKDIYTFLGVKKGQRSCFITLYNIYIVKKYIHLKSRWLKYNKAEDGLYSTAGGSPPPTYMSLCALEYQ